MSRSPLPRYRISLFFYRILLGLYPGAFRRRFASQMVEDFRELLCQERFRRPVCGRARAWAAVLADITVSLPREHLHAWSDRHAAGVRKQPNRIGTVVETSLQEIRIALRVLLKRPLFATVAIATLALGIGGSSAVFTLVDSIVLSPLPFEDSSRLVAVQHAAPGRGLEDVGQCAAWHFTYLEESRSFEELGMFGGWRMATVTGNGPPEAVPQLWVTSGVLRALRLDFYQGRDFAPEEMGPGAQPTLILGYSYWRTRFGGDPNVVGRTLVVDGITREVVGVASQDLQSLGSDPDLIIPLQYDLADLPMENFGWGAVGRLNDEVTIEEANAELNRLLPAAWERFPRGAIAEGSRPEDYRAQVLPLKDDLIGQVGELLWVLLGGVGVVLLIACANVANLFLVRADGKEGEMAVRVALGASGRRIGWEYLKESVLLGLLGGGVGLVLALIGLKGLLTMAPANLPRLEEVSLNPSVLFFTLVLSVGAGLFLGFFPILRHRRGVPVQSLKGGGRGGIGERGRNRIQGVLATSQMALALVLLVAGGLMLRSFDALRHVDPGFSNPEEILTLRLYIPGEEAPTPEGVATLFESMVRRIEDVPGVSAVGLATQIPMGEGSDSDPFYVRERPADAEISRDLKRHKWMGEGFLQALEISLVTGRSITWEDVHARAPVALLSESLAREAFGSPEAAIGQHIAARPDPPVWPEVVGVVKDVREDGLDRDPPHMVYWPLATLAFYRGMAPDVLHVWRWAGFAIRSGRVGTPGFLEEVRSAIWSLNPNLPLMQVGPLDRFMADSIVRTTFTLALLGVAGIVALALGLVGVYGVISYTVSQRGKELGMRMALGADGRQVLAMVVRRGMVLAGTGLVIGTGLALCVTRLMSALLYGVSPADPVTFGSVIAGLGTVALLASYLPARRAARVDPVVALRSE